MRDRRRHFPQRGHGLRVLHLFLERLDPRNIAENLDGPQCLVSRVFQERGLEPNGDRMVIFMPEHLFIPLVFLAGLEHIEERWGAARILEHHCIGTADGLVGRKAGNVCGRRVEMSDVSHYVNSYDPVIHAFEDAAQVDLDFFLFLKALSKLFVFCVQFNIDVFKFPLHVAVGDAELLRAHLEIGKGTFKCFKNLG